MSAAGIGLAAYESTWQAERRGYVRCKTIGHAWHDYDSNWTPMFGTPLTVRCERCGMERRDTIDWRGELRGRQYHRPAHYKMGRDEEKPTRADFRLMLLEIRGQQVRRETPKARAKSNVTSIKVRTG